MRRLILIAGLLAGCGEDSGVAALPPDGGDAGAEPDAAAECPCCTAPVPEEHQEEPPDTPAGDQLEWLLGILDAGGTTPVEVTAHFAPSFLAAIPAEQMAAVLADIAEGRSPWLLVDFEGPTGGNSLVVVVRVASDNAWYRVSVSVDATGLITGLLFTDAPDQDPRLQCWESALQRIAALAPRANFLAAEWSDTSCVPLREVEPTRSLALGSTFKLYVLLALAEAVGQGTAAWDDALLIRDDWKSLPSGTFHELAAGTSMPLQAYAADMIAVSDNTATDHLLYHLGRPAVEDALETAGHADPQSNVPFIATQEMFLFRLALTPGQIVAYLALDADDRRIYLDEDLAALDPWDYVAGVAGWTSPRDIADIEWFASAEDLCRVLGTLREEMQTVTGAPIETILSANPGIAFDRVDWPYVGFKGGSEPGVLNLSWLLRRDDGRWFVMTMGLNDTEALVPARTSTYLAGGAAALLAEEP